MEPLFDESRDAFLCKLEFFKYLEDTLPYGAL